MPTLAMAAIMRRATKRAAPLLLPLSLSSPSTPATHPSPITRIIAPIHHPHPHPPPLPPHLQRPSLLRPFAASAPSPPGSPSASKVIAVKSDLDFSRALSSAQVNGGLAVAYFTAIWCGPCRTISPVVDELSTKYNNVTFLKADLDLEGLEETVRVSQITSVPTFKFYKGGESIAELVGANANQLKDMVANLRKEE